MIRVEPESEPGNFDANVRRPGRAFLARVPKPTNADFRRGNDFWKRSARDLHAAYGGVCAYSCFYMVRTGTTDHFLPKSTHPREAYEWSNYRLCAHRMNTYKGDSTEVIDPFVVQEGWFVLDFPSCLVQPGVGLSALTQKAVESTIAVLRLNDDDDLVQERCDLMVDYSRGEVGLAHLSNRYPFLAAEIRRQGLVGKAAQVFKGRS